MISREEQISIAAEQMNQAQLDLESIAHLGRDPHFTRYFLRRLKEKWAKFDHQFHYGTMTLEERETLRCNICFLEEIIGLCQSDRVACEALTKNVRLQMGDAGPEIPIPRQTG